MKEHPTVNTIDKASLIVIGLTVVMIVGQIFSFGFLLFTHRLPEDKSVTLAAKVAPGAVGKASSSAGFDSAESKLVMKAPANQ